MLSQILLALPLLATVAAGPAQQHGPRHARHARHAEQMATRSNASPVPIFNNALLQSRAQIARRDASQPEFVREKRNKDGKKVRVMRRKVQTCKAPDGTTSQIGNKLIGQGGSAGPTASASATAAPTASASAGTDDGSEEAYSSAVASISSLHSEAGYPTDWAGPSATSVDASASASATYSASATASASEWSAAPSVTASPSYSSGVASSEAPAPSASASSDSGSESSMLFPEGRGIASWTTSEGMSLEEALNPLAAGRLPASGNAPDGSTALVANFPANTVKLASGQGFSFYTQGAHDGVDTSSAKEVVLSYSAFFEDGFEFAKGGKMPGLFGGTSMDTAKSCSGGKQDGREDCFSARLMWRADGAGEIYNYYPSGAHTDEYCNIAPMSKCDPKFGDSIGRGAFHWASGSWTTVAQRLKLNDAGQSNGEQELFVNGQSVLHLTGLEIAADPATKIYGIMAQTFFGGSDQSWASPRDQNIWFKDFSLAVIA